MSNISVPAVTAAPRDLTADERAGLARIADTLIPATAEAPAASAEPGFWEALSLALDARSDAFGDIVEVLRTLADVEPDLLWSRLHALDTEQPTTFQAVSAVITGAWLLTAGTRDRIGYHGLRSDRAGLEDAADDIGSGILDPVLEREDSRWIR